jgi:hypothetical protein
MRESSVPPVFSAIIEDVRWALKYDCFSEMRRIDAFGAPR